MSRVFTEAGRWKLWEEGRRQAIKSPSVGVSLMTDADLGSGPPSLFMFKSKNKKHGTILCGSLGVRLVAPNHRFSLVFQQEEECQRIL